MEIPAVVLQRLNQGELVAAIAIDAANKEVLMLAWMNQAALEKTLATGEVTYFSRSRNQLWRKGETSGNFQRLKKISYDCDGDALLLEVAQIGAACHNGTRSCFVNQIDFGPSEISNSKSLPDSQNGAS